MSFKQCAVLVNIILYLATISCSSNSTNENPDSNIDIMQDEASSIDGINTDDSSKDAPAQDTLTPTPCIYPDNPNPTPGYCENNIAVTCNGQTDTLSYKTCKSDEKCITYLVEEHPDNGSTGKKFNWADCVPSNADSCSWVFDTMWHPKTAASCSGNIRTYCYQPTIPEYYFTYLPFPGTQTGYVVKEPCASDEFCAPGNTSGTLQCVKNGTPACTTYEKKCDGNTIVDCTGTYENRTDCTTTGEVCYTGQCAGVTNIAFCSPSGLSSCNPTTQPQVCDTSKNYTECSSTTCYTNTVDCSTCMIVVGGTLTTIACQCASVIDRVLNKTSTTCIDAALTTCDPLITKDTCVGNTAHQCIGYIQYVDCAALGKVCGTSGSISGCKEASAPTCLPSTKMKCDNNVAVRCCPSDGVYAASTNTIVACVPGYEMRVDCGTIKEPGLPMGFFSCTLSPLGEAYCAPSFP